MTERTEREIIADLDRLTMELNQAKWKRVFPEEAKAVVRRGEHLTERTEREIIADLDRLTMELAQARSKPPQG